MPSNPKHWVDLRPFTEMILEEFVAQQKADEKWIADYKADPRYEDVKAGRVPMHVDIEGFPFYPEDSDAQP